MKKIQLQKLLMENDCKLICSQEGSIVYQLPNQQILKLFNQNVFCLSELYKDLEQKVLSADKLVLPKEIIVPKVAVYHENHFVGYIMNQAKGIDYNTMDNSLTIEERGNLYNYARIYSKLEKIIKSTSNIVYPDICTCDNIYVSENGIQLIDYDGLQIGKYHSLALSTALGSPEQYLFSSKYFKDFLFTKELDKKSLTVLYFLTTFNIDLNKVGQIHPLTNQPITVDFIFNCINLQDYDVMEKVWRLFEENKRNEYLGDDVFRIAETFDMEVIKSPLENTYLKRLSRKR